MEPYRIESREDLAPILGGLSLHRVSLYLPVGRHPESPHADELHERAALEGLTERLRMRDVAESEIGHRLLRLDALAPEASTHTRTRVWLGDEKGWALAELPEALHEHCVVGPHYALRPLLRAFQGASRFRLLAVSANRVTAFEGDAAGLHPLELAGIPRSLEEALGSELEGGDLSYRSDAPVAGARANAPIYHGHGGADAGRASDRERFHRVLGAAINERWRDSALPVVLAAEVRTLAELRKHLELPDLLHEELRGNPDDASPGELLYRALPIVCSALEDRQRRLTERYETARNAGKAIDGKLEDLAVAAIAGRVRCLWIEEGARVPGQLDELRGSVAPCADPEEDALDGLVTIVLRAAGEVRVVGSGETPTATPFCAELR